MLQRWDRECTFCGFAARRARRMGGGGRWNRAFQLKLVMPGHSRPKDGVASASLCPGHPHLNSAAARKTWVAGTKPGHDGLFAPPKNQKAGSRPAALQRSIRPRREPGRSERSTRARRLLLLRLLSLLSLLCLLRFLSHSILIWVNGWKRDTRHARRRANLATSSITIPTDSRAAAPHCHAGVITLSTAVMRFDAVLAPRCAPRLRIFQVRDANDRSAGRPPGLTMRQRADAFCLDRALRRAIFTISKPRLRLPRRGSESVKRRCCMLVARLRG
jgi:hypothetical protein